MKTAGITPYKELYDAESAKIRAAFEASLANEADDHLRSSSDQRPGSVPSLAALAERSSLVDRIIVTLFNERITHSDGFAIVALGGYGLAHLFPYSDIDLLLLSANPGVEEAHKTEVSAIIQTLWDLRLK